MAGVKALWDRVSLFIIVDVLSFSTAVDIAVSRGASVYRFPHGGNDAAQAAADKVGAVLAQPRRAVGAQLSLSPISLMALRPGMKLMLPSPNGSRLSFACGDKPVLAGCVRNAAAVARVAREMAGSGTVGVIPAGERWPDNSLRPAIEDLLGAGAIVHHLALPCSPEAKVARDAFHAAGGELASMVRASVSGQELINDGFADDVELAVEQDASISAPSLTEGAYRAA